MLMVIIIFYYYILQLIVFYVIFSPQSLSSSLPLSSLGIESRVNWQGMLQSRGSSSTGKGRAD